MIVSDLIRELFLNSSLLLKKSDDAIISVYSNFKNNVDRFHSELEEVNSNKRKVKLLKRIAHVHRRHHTKGKTAKRLVEHISREFRD